MIDRIKLLTKKFNKGVFWLKVGYSLWAMATMAVMPFISLQMSALGLSDGDISLILGFMPFTMIPIIPIIGMIGDKFGYKYIICIDCILVGAAFTSFSYVPHFSEGNLKITNFNLTDNNELYSIQWPVCNETCEDSLPITDTDTFIVNITEYIIETLNITDLQIPELNYNGSIKMENGTFCQLLSDLEFENTTNYNLPDILEVCDSSCGSHTVTFWYMVAAIFAYRLTLTTGFSMLDGVSQLQAAKHHSKYNYILFYTITLETISPFISSWTIQDNEGSSGKKFLVNFCQQ